MNNRKPSLSVTLPISARMTCSGRAAGTYVIRILSNRWGRSQPRSGHLETMAPGMSGALSTRHAAWVTAILVALTGLLGFSRSCGAQRVRGAVRTPDGVPLARVEVLALPESLSTLTDNKGLFRLGPLSSGKHELRFRRLGFVPAVVNAYLVHADTTVTVTLQPIAQLLDTVRTLALAQRLPRVFAREQAHLGALAYGKRLTDLLNRDPGMPVEDLMRMDRAFALKLMNRPRCERRTYVDGVRTRAPLRFYISEPEIAAIEVFDSPDFVHEPFIDGEGYRPGQCMILTLVWSTRYQQRPWAGH